MGLPFMLVSPSTPPAISQEEYRRAREAFEREHPRQALGPRREPGAPARPKR